MAGKGAVAGTEGTLVGARPIGLAWLRRLDPLAAAEIAAFAAAAPLLVFPNRFSPVALALLPAAWLARLIVRRRTLRRTAADWPLIGLLLMLSVSLYPSVDLDLSRPKLYGLILGLFLFTLLVEHLRTALSRQVLAVALVLGGVGVAAAGLVGTQWLAVKIPILGPLYARLPRLITGVESSFGTIDGFHPNEIGGTLALLLPFTVGVALFATERRVRFALGLAALAMLGTLGLTISRSALTGVVLAALMLAILRWRRVAFALPAVALGLAGATLWLGPARVGGWLLALETATGASGQGRLEVWSRAWYMIQDFPFTGIGLNTFPIVADLLYPFLLAGPDAKIPHAHSFFLQVAVDFGVPGFVSFVGLVLAAAIGLARAWPRAAGWERGLIAGLGAGLLGHFVFGLTDAITLGAKPGIFLWAVLGGAVALGASARPPDSTWGAGTAAWLGWLLFALAGGLGAFVALSGIKMLP